jgi:uncharacterized protein YkwD
MKKLTTTLICLTALHSSSYSQNATEMLTELQDCMNRQKEVAPIVKKIRSMPNSERKQLIVRVERAWPKVRQQYLFDLKQAIQSAKNQSNPAQSHARIGQLREQFLGAYRLPESEMPSALKSQSAPALRELQARMLPSSQAIIQAGGSALKVSQHRANALATFRDALLLADAARIAADSQQSLRLAEQQAAVSSSEVNQKASHVIAQNRRIAAQHRIPDEVVKGIEECNKWRILAGLHACIIDPKLCLTAYDHAKDMEQGKFFSHESPIAGKKTPWDRAMRFSTTASGENIFMGSSSYSVANQRWFHSPGHHKVMFDPSFRRIGLARQGQHWVQMFGR